MEEMVMHQQLSLPATYEQKLTPETVRRVQRLKTSIDIHNRGKVIAYGSEEQAQLGHISDSMLNGVGAREFGEARELLTRVMKEINGYNEESIQNERGFFAFFKKQKSKLQLLQNKYKFLADNMKTVVKDLQAKDYALNQISRSFEAMYVENQSMIELLTMIIYAGELVLQDEREKLEEMRKSAGMFGDSMEIQRVSDFEDDINRFEKRLYDLKLTRTIAIQQSPQIRMVQKNADNLSESIKTTIITAIPLWKNQMAMALGMQVVKEGLTAVNAVRDATNAMLIKNSQMNKEITLETARALERGVVDVETINAVNQNLIEALSGSYEIAHNAIISRNEGAKRLQNNEAELKAAIVQYTNLN